MTKKKCEHCNSPHHPSSYHTEKYINDKGFPSHPHDKYEKAHIKADKAEKKKYPKGYEELKKLDNTLSKHELAGKNTKSGKIEVSKKVPSPLREEVRFHEKVENKILRKKK
jgi:hypothetical protein